MHADAPWRPIIPGRTLLHWPRASPETSAHASHKNHKQVCTVTCVKYQKKPTASSFATASRSRQKKKGTGISKCRLHFYTNVRLLIDSTLKYVMRRRKCIVPEPFVPTGNEENE